MRPQCSVNCLAVGIGLYTNELCNDLAPSLTFKTTTDPRLAGRTLWTWQVVSALLTLQGGQFMMLKLLRKLLRSEDSYERLKESSSSIHPRLPIPSAPPSYRYAICEKLVEIQYLTKQIDILEGRSKRSLKRYAYAEARLQSHLTEMEKLRLERKKEIYDALMTTGQIPSSRSYRLCKRIIKEEILFVKKQRDHVRQKYIFLQEELLYCRSRRETLQKRFEQVERRRM